MSGILLGLSALGTFPGAYREGRAKDLAYKEAQADAEGLAALGDAMRIAGQGGGMTPGALPGMPPPPPPMGGGPGGAPSMPPGAGSQPAQPPPQPGPPPGPGPSPGTVNPQMVAGQAQNLTGPVIPKGGFGPPVEGPYKQAIPPQQPPPPPAGGAPPGMRPAPPGMPGGGNMSQPGMGQWSLPQLAQAIQQRNPGISGRALFTAMQQAAQMLRPYDQLALRAEMMQQHMQELQMRLAMQERGQDIRSETQRRGQEITERGQDIRSETQRRGQDLSASPEVAAEKAKARLQATGELKAEVQDLTKLRQQQSAVNSFENTAIKNGEVLVDLAKKVDKTGVPVFERWIRAGRHELAGDTDVSEFNFQYQTFVTEVARILQSPNLTGALPVSMRHEIQEGLPRASSAKQFEQTFQRIKKDFQFRKDSIDDEVKSVRENIRGQGKGGTQQPIADNPSTMSDDDLRKKLGL